MNIFEIILSFLIPFLIFLFRKNKIIYMLGSTCWAYLTGIIFALVLSLLSYLDILPARDTSALEIVCYLAISLAIPLLLFSNNIKYIKNLSKLTVVAFLLLILSVFLVSAGLFFIFTKNVENGEILSGMAVGLYTGGTPNLNSIAYIFGLDNQTLLASNISDMIFGGLFFVFLLFFSKPILSKFLKNDRQDSGEIKGNLFNESLNSDFSFNKGIIGNFLLSVLTVIISAGAGYLIFLLSGSKDGTLTNYLMPSLMIGTTLLGILFSFNNKIRNVKENSILGQYFVGVFGFSIASMINLETLSSVSLEIFLVYSIITTMTFVVFAVFCKIFKIGSDIMITSATAGIYGPAFIPSITRAINADYMLGAGLVLGSIGYSVGTFLGVGFVKLLLLF